MLLCYVYGQCLTAFQHLPAGSFVGLYVSTAYFFNIGLWLDFALTTIGALADRKTMLQSILLQLLPMVEKLRVM